MSDKQQVIWPHLPIVRWEFYVERNDEFGWKLRQRHAHPGGMLNDCRSVTYSWMTLPELLDVLEAELETTLHRQAPPR